MLIRPDCISCILKMTISAIKKLSLDENSVKALYTEILEIPALRGLFWDTTSAEVIENVWKKIVKKVNSPDPFYTEKLSQNEKIKALYPFLEKMVNEAADPLKLAVKLSILGNSMDLMVADKALTIENSITEKVKAPLSNENYSKFRQQLQETQHLLIFGDNAGEIVFDRLLIETIKKIHQPEIVFVVRSVPTLNDATLNEAKTVGLDEIVTVIENGIDGPLPGTLLSRCSSEVNDLVRRSDLIISKGGGNFDTLDEQRKHLNKNISFLLLSKCEPYYDHFGVKLYHPILANFYEKRP
ncbi:MAG: ARMT1-like domain-containing protein [Desulfobacterales bacterium]